MSTLTEVRRRRRPLGQALRISTERVASTTAPATPDEGNVVATVFLGKQRERRVRRGDAYLRRCVLIFMVSLSLVLTTPQYSNRYYLSWAATYASFFFMLPSVLPTDNTKIKVVLFATSWNMACGWCVALRYGVKKLRITHCDVAPAVCAWNPFFWFAHSLNAGFFAVAAIHAAFRLAPAKGLHRLWRWCGFYFILVAVITFVDLTVSYHSGKYDPGTKYRVAGLWNLVLAVEQFLIGRLCLHNRFKLWTWRYAASLAKITVRDDTPSRRGQGGDDPDDDRRRRALAPLRGGAPPRRTTTTTAPHRPRHRTALEHKEEDSARENTNNAGAAPLFLLRSGASGGGVSGGTLLERGDHQRRPEPSHGDGDDDLKSGRSGSPDRRSPDRTANYSSSAEARSRHHRSSSSPSSAASSSSSSSSALGGSRAPRSQTTTSHHQPP